MFNKDGHYWVQKFRCKHYQHQIEIHSKAVFAAVHMPWELQHVIHNVYILCQNKLKILYGFDIVIKLSYFIWVFQGFLSPTSLFISLVGCVCLCVCMWVCVKIFLVIIAIQTIWINKCSSCLTWYKPLSPLLFKGTATQDAFPVGYCVWCSIDYKLTLLASHPPIVHIVVNS